MKSAVIILGHGSRSAGADEEIRRVAAGVRKAGAFEIVEHAFLQYAAPTADEAIDSCIRKQAGQIVIVPFFLQSGAHVTKDLPRLAERSLQRYPNVRISVTDPVGSHPLMVKIVEELAREQV